MRPLKRRERLLLVVGVTAIGALLVFALLYVPRFQDLRLVQREAQRKQAELARTVGLVQRGEEIERAHAQAREASQALLSRMPAGPRLPELIALLAQAIKASGVQLQQISFSKAAGESQGAATASGIEAVPLVVQVRGSYREIRSFAGALETLPRVVAMDRLVMTGGESGITAEFSLRALYVR